ncbi:hypothetical protein SAMN05445756_0986 [Kytococcus aerolatus]|uniref:Transmembrane protein n=1 Tax=Kytococcus aerolatus TaxID=592308 RepID=A0A212TCS2_9MICO|nr:hypothetical protein [Kytococcus aerolatus]SNC63823.1 hypothetical protein SAMN05445756_0986 [Kytococcus aerolatus]
MPTGAKLFVALCLLLCVVSLMGVLNPKAQDRTWRRLTFWRKAPEPTRGQLVRRGAINGAVLVAAVTFIAIMVYDLRPI